MLGERFSQCFTTHHLKRPAASTIPRSAITATSSCSCSCPCSASAVDFNSLYDPVYDCELTGTLTLPFSSTRASGSGARSSSSSPRDCTDEAAVGGGSCPSERDLSTAIASRRLLLAPPGKSNSIVDDAAVVAVGVGSGVAVPKYAPDPYSEFRRSMEEMVAALKLDARKHRAHLHELLLCYLALNRKHAHKYIVGAFTDLLLGLTAPAAAAADDDE